MEVFSNAFTKQLLDYLNLTITGVQVMSAQVPGMVESSLNLGIVKTELGKIYLAYSVRSQKETYNDHMISQMFVGETKAEVVVRGEYPAWDYKEDSVLREVMTSCYEKRFEESPCVEGIHAGLECGILLQKLPNLDIVSMGPEIQDIHTVKEKLSISSAKRNYDYLLDVLAALAGERYLRIGETMEKFEILGKDLVYHGTIIDFYKLKLRTPAGHEVSWDHIEHKGASAVLPIDDEGKVLTVTQYRGAIDDIMIEIPAGGRDSVEEDFAVCAARELEEETGFRAGSLEHLVDVHTAAAYTSEKIAVYVAKDLIPSRQHLDEDEFVDIRRYTFEELNDMIFSGKITDSKTIAAVMAYQTKQRK